MPFNLFISSLYILYFIIILLSLDNDVLETLKRYAMFYNILSQIFIVKCFAKSLLEHNSSYFVHSNVEKSCLMVFYSTFPIHKLILTKCCLKLFAVMQCIWQCFPI